MENSSEKKVHKLFVGEGMITACGLPIECKLNNENKVEYTPAYTVFEVEKINCEKCLNIIKK